MMKAVAYVRVSTAEQADKGVSLEAQEAKIRQWCAFNEYELLNVYRDAGISGLKADNRPGLQSALDEACKHRGVLVVYSLSRMSRSTQDTFNIAARLDKRKAHLASITEKWDTTSASGEMLFGILAVLARFESRQTGERTKTALAHKRSKGEMCGGHVPYGYRLDSDGKTLRENPTEQKTIALVQQLRADGQTFKAIQSELQRRKIRTRKGTAKWSSGSLFNMVKGAA